MKGSGFNVPLHQSLRKSCDGGSENSLSGFETTGNYIYSSHSDVIGCGGGGVKFLGM
jgi:hypothetical protein